MSTAAKFLYYQPFPFCPSDISTTGLSRGLTSHIDNLSLSDVMAFAWNLETFSISTTGTITAPKTNVGDMTFTLSAVASDRLTEGVIYDNGLWFGDYFSLSAFASWPTIRQPRSRVCFTAGTSLPSGFGPSPPGCLMYADYDGPSVGVNPNKYKAIATLAFWIGTDPVNTGQFRIYYFFNFESQDVFDSTANIIWRSESTVGGMTVITNGTITICGQSFNYWSFKPTGGTATGGTMSCTSSTSFTY